jgi:hypothetical protein
MRPRSHPLGDWKGTHLPDKGLDTTGTTVGLVEGNLTNDLATELPAIILSDEMFCDEVNGRSRHTCGAS